MTVPLFPSTSRYYSTPTAKLELPDGTTVAYLQRRFVPPPERFELLQEHVVLQGERLDNITAHYLGDPEQFWQVCDANNAMHPDALTATPGRRLRITLPEGIPGNPHA
ncbi:MAG: LysM domain-containing protein [Herpetosiphonaceae bacterium]|nr:LysM domain-containing protein [Herpetosiphonaceae bacterium]